MTNAFVKPEHACPRCGGLVYYDSFSFVTSTNICTICGRSHTPGAARDSIDRQFDNYKEYKHDTDTEAKKARI